MLKDSKNDLILWGQVLGAAQAKDRLLRLHVTARDAGAAGTGRLAAEQAIKLPIAGAALLQSAIRTQVLARLNSFNRSKAIAKVLLQEVERVEQMVSSFPPGQTRSAMLATLGNAQLTVGEQLGDRKHLLSAMAAFREALKEYTRSALPLDWAATQNNLGSALRTLGERERDSARLKEAVVAYQSALEEFRAAKASHYIDLAEKNLARAEAVLQKLQTQT